MVDELSSYKNIGRDVDKLSNSNKPNSLLKKQISYFVTLVMLC